MARIVVLQCCVTLLCALIAALVSGRAAGLSALLGGLCYTVPNALFALRLYLGGKKRTDGVERINPFTFFTGEFLKMLAVGGLLAAVAVWYHELHWLAFIVSFILVLKSYLLLLFVKP